MSYEAPWIEKYRPEVLQDVVGNAEAIERLRAITSMGNLPNLILSGPPGTGKTTSILCLAREMLGEEVYKQAVLELNASDARYANCICMEVYEYAYGMGMRFSYHDLITLPASLCRGIDVVRNKIKMFAQKKVTLPAGRHKIVILDEADSMTASAQQALRRTMEIYSHSTRYAVSMCMVWDAVCGVCI
ncbi:AAA family ATPase [archaeon]|nr:MAG: AAA family ATPase [archaeon]